jgi:hypothetical protein
LYVDELIGTPWFTICNRIIDCQADERKAMLAVWIEKGKVSSSDVTAGFVDQIGFN